MPRQLLGYGIFIANIQIPSTMLPCLLPLVISKETKDCHRPRTHVPLGKLKSGKWLKPSKFVAAREALKWKVYLILS